MRKPTSILIVTGLYPPEIGGPATYTKLIEEKIRERHIKVSILPFRIVRFLPKFIRHFIFFLHVLSKARKVNVIYAQDPVSVGLPSFLAAKVLGKRFIIKIVGDYAWEQGVQRFGVTCSLDEFYNRRHKISVRILLWVEHLVSRGSYKIIVPSQYLKDLVIKQWNIQASKVRVIYNSFERKSIVLTKSQAKANLGLEDKKIILTAGRLVPWKRFELLVEWLAPLLRKYKELRLFIIGSGPLEDKLKNTISSSGLGKEIKLLGSLEKDALRRYLRAADMFVLNSTYEGFSHQLLEALAAETPVIATDVGGNPELIENGKSGILFETHDLSTFRESVEGLITDKALLQRLIDGGLKRLESFNENSMIADLIEEFY